MEIFLPYSICIFVLLQVALSLTVSTESPTIIPTTTPVAYLTINTIAGNGSSIYSGDNGPALLASIPGIARIWLDTTNNRLLFSDCTSSNIRAVSLVSQIISNFAGTAGIAQFRDNVSPSMAYFKCPMGLVGDNNGNDVYVADSNNNRIRKITTSIVTTIAGQGSTGYSGDGLIATSTSVRFSAPTGLWRDSLGNTFIADQGNNAIRKIASSTNIISTVIGITSGGYNLDGYPGTLTQLGAPTEVIGDTLGNLYISDYLHARIRKWIASSGLVTTVAGTGTNGYNGDNIRATSAQLHSPTQVWLDSIGNIYIVEYGVSRLRRVDAFSLQITTVTGNGNGGYGGDSGPASNGLLRSPRGVTGDSSGSIYIADTNNFRLRVISPGYSTLSPTLAPTPYSVIVTVAGSTKTSYSGDGDFAVKAGLSGVEAVWVDSLNDVYFTECTASVLRQVNLNSGIITLYAGIPNTKGFTDNMNRLSAKFNCPTGLVGDSNNNFYIADQTNMLIRKISNDVVTTIAGTLSTSGYTGDNGPATSATFNTPTGVAVDSLGNIFVVDSNNCVIRKINAISQIITTVIGQGPTACTFNGDGGVGTLTQLNLPYDVALDSLGNIYVADSQNDRIRKLVAYTKTVTTVAGGSYVTSANNLPATSTLLRTPKRLWLDSQGNIYFLEYDGNVVRRINVYSGVAVIVAFTGLSGSSGDGGPALLAKTRAARAFYGDSIGRLFIGDQFNKRIRMVTAGYNSPTPTSAPTGFSTILTVAGNGSNINTGDGGQAILAGIAPTRIWVDTIDRLFITISSISVVRMVDLSTGIITLFAGIPNLSGYNGDDIPATFAKLSAPQGLGGDTNGNIYVADSMNYIVRQVSYTGIISTVAGTATVSGYDGNGGAATSANLGRPLSVWLDSLGNIFIADYNNCVVRKVTKSDGIISTIVGKGPSFCGYNGDNLLGTNAALRVYDIAGDLSGNLFIFDASGLRVRSFSTSSNIITTIAGSGSSGSSADNIPATMALLEAGTRIWVDCYHNLFISEYNSHQVRKVDLLSGLITTIAGLMRMMMMMMRMMVSSFHLLSSVSYYYYSSSFSLFLV